MVVYGWLVEAFLCQHMGVWLRKSGGTIWVVG